MSDIVGQCNTFIAQLHKKKYQIMPEQNGFGHYFLRIWKDDHLAFVSACYPRREQAWKDAIEVFGGALCL